MVHGMTGSYPTTPSDKSRRLQRRLYLAAKRKRNRRFHALYDRIYRPDVLWRAWQEVKRNKGKPGVDDISIDLIDSGGVQSFLGVIADVVPPHPATRIMQLGVVHKIHFSTVLGSCIPVMNGVDFYCIFQSTEQSQSQLVQKIQNDGAKHILA